MLQKRAAGTSDYADRSEVDFSSGKKHGVERVLGADGKLESTITWNSGVKDGKESAYAEGGSKLVKLTVWTAGEVSQVTEYYLNGNPKSFEQYAEPKQRQVRSYWDTGKVKTQGVHVQCTRYGRRDWCEDGLVRSYFEDGAPESETSWKLGQRHGPSKRWWPNGKPAAVEQYVDDRMTKSQRWDEAGKPSADEEYEADGSRKLRR